MTDTPSSWGGVTRNNFPRAVVWTPVVDTTPSLVPNFGIPYYGKENAMTTWDKAALDQERNRADWYRWCDRHFGFDYPTPYRASWAREQFKVALAEMPNEHPDRWKYEVGSRCAPFSYTNHSKDLWRLLGIISGSVIVGLIGGLLTYGISTVVVAGLWVYFGIRNHRLLSS